METELSLEEETLLSVGAQEVKQMLNNNTTLKTMAIFDDFILLFLSIQLKIDESFDYTEISAITSTSTNTSFGSSFTATQERAGFSVKYFP